MDLLIPSSGLLFWMTITFFVVLGILWKWGFPAITDMVRERKAFIDESLQKAHEANDRLANIQQEGESILHEARGEQARILKEAADTRDAIVGKAQEKAKAEGARLISEAKAEAESERQNAINDIRAQVAQLSVKIAEGICSAVVIMITLMQFGMICVRMIRSDLAPTALAARIYSLFLILRISPRTSRAMLTQ